MVKKKRIEEEARCSCGRPAMVSTWGERNKKAKSKWTCSGCNLLVRWCICPRTDSVTTGGEEDAGTANLL